MTNLIYPSVTGHLALFRDRIRQSVPPKVDRDWLMGNLAINSESNARTLMRTLVAAEWVNDEGLLTDRGKSLFASQDSEDYRAAMADALLSLAGDDTIASIRSGALTSGNLKGHLQKTHTIGSSAVGKALRAWTWIAREAGEDTIASVTGGRSATTASASEPNGEKPAKGSPARRAKRTQHVVDPAPIAAVSQDPVKHGQLLSGQVVQVRIDSGWELGDIRSVLRMLQLVERGELITEGVNDDTDLPTD